MKRDKYKEYWGKAWAFFESIKESQSEASDNKVKVLQLLKELQNIRGTDFLKDNQDNQLNILIYVYERILGHLDQILLEMEGWQNRMKKWLGL